MLITYPLHLTNICLRPTHADIRTTQRVLKNRKKPYSVFKSLIFYRLFANCNLSLGTVFFGNQRLSLVHVENIGSKGTIS